MRAGAAGTSRLVPAEPVILPIDEYEVVLSYAKQRATLLPASPPRIVDLAAAQP